MANHITYKQHTGHDHLRAVSPCHHIDNNLHHD